MSARNPTLSPRACSGLMYEGVPWMTPVCVTAGARQCIGGRWSEIFGEPEVQDLHSSIGRDRNVGGLQIPVHDALAVFGFERLRNLQRDAQGLLDGHRLAPDPIRERAAFNQLEDQKPTPPCSSSP